MAQFTIYKSSDGSAPSLTGQVGSLLTVLDACLVNGYTGKVAAGWTKPFVNSGNVGCYQQGAGANLFLSVNDNGPGAGGAQESRMTGYEGLSAVATGTNPFPTAAQGVGGVAMVVLRKSSTADATARTWIVIADSKTFYMLVATGDSAGTYLSFGFGEFYSFVASDPWRDFIAGRSVENSATITNDKLDALSALGVATAGNFVVRNYVAAVGSLTLSKHGDGVKGSASTLLGSVPYLNNSDLGIYSSPVWVVESGTSTIRGRLRGFRQFLHAISSVTDGQLFAPVSGDLANHTYQIFKQSGNAGVYMIETSNTLETN